MSLNRLSAQMMDQVVNRLLALDAEAQTKLLSFETSHFLIEITDWQLKYRLSIVDGKLSISDANNSHFNDDANDSEQPSIKINATISGTSSAFLASLQEEHKGDSIFKGQLNFSGQINSAKKLQAFAQSLHIDWQEPLAQVFGDPIGHSLASGIQSFAGWLQKSLKQAPINFAEYLQEEVRLTPSSFELDYFSQQVDEIRSQTDRLNARIQRLANASSKSEQN